MSKSLYRAALSFGIAMLVVGFTSRCADAATVDRSSFTFTQYDLRVGVTPDDHGLAVSGRVTLRNNSAVVQTTAALQISSSLHWLAITVGGKPLQFLVQPLASDIDHTGGLTEAVVTLPAAVAPHGSVELQVAYQGPITADATRLTRIGTPVTGAATSDWDQISESFTAVRGVGYVAWYPVAADPASLSQADDVFRTLAEWKHREAQADMKVDLCWEAPTALSVIANGELEGIGRSNSAADEGQVTGCTPYRFSGLEHTVPTFAIGDYVALDRPDVTVYHTPDHKLTAEDYVVATEKLVPFTTEWFGKPRAKVIAVELTDPNAEPYESGALVFTPLRSGQSKTVELLMAHQLVHASFPSPRQWIYEGLAQFAQALQREQQDGRQAALDYMAQHLPALVAAEKAAQEERGAGNSDKGAGESLVAAADSVFYATKAMYVWWMLRDMIGDQALQRVLRSYQPDADKQPAYVQRLIAAQSKRDLEWFFDDWVYRDRGLPDFQVESAYPRKMVAGEYMVTVTVKNAGRAGGQVPVVVKPRPDTKPQQIIVPANGTGVTRIVVPAVPTEAVVNDGSVPEMDQANNSLKINNSK